MTYASELVALLAAGLFAGGAVFVSVAEHPARTEAGANVALAQFPPSYRRAAPLQGGSALVALVAGIIAAIAGGNWEWALAAGCVGSAIPLTLLVIAPVNRRLMSDAAQLTDAEATELFASWARLHALRTLAGLAGFAIAAAIAVSS
ncbi:MAG: DUF1772 domain-containing protein [Actinobacteria bacterium]|nr:MAG: DUF1772 domain-containing protein [Actinomycetota bacterium]